jgi:hypothetical protein
VFPVPAVVAVITEAVHHLLQAVPEEEVVLPMLWHQLLRILKDTKLETGR